MSLPKVLASFAVFSALLFGAEAFAGDTCDCQSRYDSRMAGCDQQSLSDEARSLCYAKAKSNFKACNNSCSNSDGSGGN